MKDETRKPQPMLMGMREFAEVSGLSYWYVRQLTFAGKLPYIAIGKVKKIPREAGLDAVQQLVVKAGA